MKYLKKGVTIGVILLFISIAVSPSVTADKDRILEFKPSEVNYKQLLKVSLNLKQRIETLSQYTIDNECGCSDIGSSIYPPLICWILWPFFTSILVAFIWLDFYRIYEDPDSILFYIVYNNNMMFELLGKVAHLYLDVYNCPFDIPWPSILPQLER